MASCKDCVHFEVCISYVREAYKRANLASPDLNSFRFLRCDDCEHFKDRSRFVELPCHVGDIVTTIDEAIDHCYQIATSTDETVCAECKAEHMRLCGWLGDLKRGIAAKQA